MGRSFRRFGWLLGLVACAACGGGVETGGGDPGNNPVDASRPGIGSSKDAPQGTPYVLPAGVELSQPIPGYGSDCIQDTKNPPEQKGSGALVSVCMALHNTTSQPVSVELPAGLILVSKDLASQNGLLAQAVLIQVPAQQTLPFVLHLYCINEDRAPTASWDIYALGPVTQDPGLREVMSLVEDKSLPVPGLMEVQYAISNVTDGPGLTAQDREALKNIPRRSAGLEPQHAQ